MRRKSLSSRIAEISERPEMTRQRKPLLVMGSLRGNTFIKIVNMNKHRVKEDETAKEEEKQLETMISIAEIQMANYRLFPEHGTTAQWLRPLEFLRCSL